ncbi:CBN-DIC-1 protein [Caenorhabditis brenneri]|uniref:CBN-DIC-1 protein n=1 Tax=Caenorhabditis brenneri TaxID=135651 RepID=G0PFH0_CAEBE|nr:CBN-DIC-1 protein [Caenorhabditis brenneri]
MPCFFFILDTSASMSTRAHPQFSFFDLAKNYIETFIKVRSRNDTRMMMGRENDRYFLSTTSGKYPENVKVVSEKAPIIVVEELRKLVLPYGTAQLHTAILDAFKVLHVNRAQTGIDGVGTGRVIQNSEQIMIILLTDGSGIAGIPSEFQLFFDPPFLGSEMTKEAFRWDQKLYTVVFRIPSTPYRPTNSQLTLIDIDHVTIEKLCAKTGGRSFSIVSVRQINTSIDHILMTATQHKIGVRFDCLPTIPGTVTQDEVNRLKAKFKKVSDKKPVTNLISRLNPQGRPVTCHWVIPESYFPVRAMDNLPQRTAHPVILCAPKPLPLTIRNDLPLDKLELEMGGVTEIIMEILQGRRDLCVWTYIEGSSNGPTAPFGCLRVNTVGTGISLILLPFNFPMFYPLVEEVVKEPVLTQSQVWRARLDSYFSTVPYYYFTQMRICLDKIKVKVEYNSSMSNIYAGTLLSHLNRLKVKAKDEYDQIGYASKLNERGAYNFMNPMIRIERITSRTRMIGLEDDDSEEPCFDAVEPPIYAAGDRIVPLYPPAITEASLDTAYRTPYTTNIEDLVSKLPRIQANLEMVFNPHKPTLLDMAKLGAKPRFNTLEELHNMPQKHMGEYEPYQAARIRHYGQPMRKIDEEKDRTHAFGNPYKLKGLGAGIDEVMDSAVMDSNTTQGTSSNPQQKRFGGDFRGGMMGTIGGGGPPRRRRGPLGIDAFDQYRTRRSIRGSSAASSVASDLSDLGSSGDFSDPGTPGASGGPGTPNSEFEDLQLQEMDTDEELAANLEEVYRRKKADGGRGSEDVEMMEQEGQEGQKETSSSLPPAGLLTKQEILTRKIQIGSIVRRPANHRAFEEIMKLVEGIIEDTAISLIQYAVRESQRFKLRQLTERLENQLR